MTETFCIVVLEFRSPRDHRRHVRAFERLLKTSRIDAELQTTRTVPFVVKTGLTLSDALVAQFELICCDIVSAFIADTVVATADPGYLAELYSSLVHSDEFSVVSISVNAVPDSDSGREFTRQFIGEVVPVMPHAMQATRKKARTMLHWAEKIGASVSFRT